MFSILNAIDAACGHLLPAAVRVGLYGLIVGVVAMLIYWRLSPQKKLGELKKQISESQRALRAYDGTDVREILRLSRQTIAPAFKQLAFVLGPTIVAAIPVIGVITWLESGWSHRASELLSFGPGWVRTWHAPFFTALTIAALGMKFGFKIR
jgi:uncharacterized membrane protein (DUF106 family)